MITSTANQRVKRLTNLRKKRKLRDEEGVFLVEGIRMFREVPVKHLNQLRWKTKHRELNSEWDEILGINAIHR